MLRANYQIRFNCPGFLGDAEQQSAWRAPPFKALLQHWWRIAVAKQYNYEWQQVREAEGRLFGHAWLDNGSWAMRSRVSIKLAHQDSGNLKNWVNSPANLNITHPEVKDKHTGKLRPMRPETYLAYGPLHYANGLAHSPAINANEKNQLTFTYPETEKAIFRQTLQLIHWFGTLGGRSRNGWGSVGLEGESIEQNLDIETLNLICRPLSECLHIEWPHAIGSDNQGLLIWQTQQRANWQQVVKDLAQAKIKFRTDLEFPASRPGNFEKRHLLAYPVTNHKVNEWGSNGRLANQVRFKVVQKDNQFIGIIAHLPCGLPKEMRQALRNPPSIQEQMTIWESVHQSLDGLKQSLGITRINS